MESLTIAPAAPRLRITFDKKPRPWDAAKAELKRLGFVHAGIEKTWEGPDSPETRAYLGGLGLAKAAPAKASPVPVSEPEPERVPPIVESAALTTSQAATAVATLPDYGDASGADALIAAAMAYADERFTPVVNVPTAPVMSNRHPKAATWPL